MASTEILKIRPYARLLTMLGEQLIKNERIAIVELLKNSYDADSPWVKLSFIGFGNKYEIRPDSKIVIEDAGEGMPEEIIRNHWLNPATPEKKRRKEKKETTSMGRILQGEKGIGRFAIFKLGRNIKVITRPKGKNIEYEISYDFSKYDDEFLTDKTNTSNKHNDIFLEDLSVSLSSRKPQIITSTNFSLGLNIIHRQTYGTRIEISDLKGSWSKNKIENISRDISRLQSIFTGKIKKRRKSQNEKDFNVWIYKNDEHEKYREDWIEKLEFLLQERAVFRIEDGSYNELKKEFRFSLNGKSTVLKLSDPSINGIKEFKKYYEENLRNRKTDCGSFQFAFYIFDFTPQAPPKFVLDNEDKNILKDHRIYLYRDGIRVYPYGDPKDDWLGIDIGRGTISAGHYLSNDQVVGYASISQKDNPKLKDKTNREGLIDDGNGTEDFRILLRTLLRYLRKKPYSQYRLDIKSKKVHDLFKTEQVQQEFAELKLAVKGNSKALGLVAKAEKEYKAERRYLVQRAETTEDLAGVGLSVETASHDIMAIMAKATSSIDSLISETLHEHNIDHNTLQKEFQSLRGMLSFIESQLSNIQLLFKSSKQRRRKIKVKSLLEKVERIYKRLFKKFKISLEISQIGSPLIAKTTDAVLLQLFINLFDNSVYWLEQVSSRSKKIEIILDGDSNQMIFSDNGPGIDKDDQPYIFEPFYSGKGEEGRGLGLYIARQLLERNDYSINLAELKSEHILKGANFVVSFVAED